MSPAEFENAIENGSLRLAFVGMSNVGKSSRSRALKSARNFTHAHVDGDIHQALGLHKKGMSLSEWLDYPDSEGFAERERRYLKLEEQFTTTSERDVDGNLVLDTTGSVVHLDDKAQQKLKERFFVVNLDVGEGAVSELTERFFAVPKPIVWGSYFSTRPGETLKQSLIRCYPELLRARLDKYRTLGHVSIPAFAIELDDGDAVLEEIRSYL